MANSLTLYSSAALFGTMVILALLPSVSVLTVAARAATGGFRHGVVTAMGIVAGDIIFIIIAIYGLSLVIELTGRYFVLLKYLGGLYFIGLGIALWQSKSATGKTHESATASLLSSFLAGLLITLGDQKAILFYLMLFPAFVDLSALTLADTAIIIAVASVAVGGAKLVYALLADRARTMLTGSGIAKGLKRVAASVIIGVGALLLSKALPLYN